MLLCQYIVGPGLQFQWEHDVVQTSDVFTSRRRKPQLLTPRGLLMVVTWAVFKNKLLSLETPSHLHSGCVAMRMMLRVLTKNWGVASQKSRMVTSPIDKWGSDRYWESRNLWTEFKHTKIETYEKRLAVEFKAISRRLYAYLKRTTRSSSTGSKPVENWSLAASDFEKAALLPQCTSVRFCLHCIPRWQVYQQQLSVHSLRRKSQCPLFTSTT